MSIFGFKSGLLFPGMTGRGRGRSASSTIYNVQRWKSSGLILMHACICPVHGFSFHFPVSVFFLFLLKDKYYITKFASMIYRKKETVTSHNMFMMEWMCQRLCLSRGRLYVCANASYNLLFSHVPKESDWLHQGYVHTAGKSGSFVFLDQITEPAVRKT